MGEFNINNSKVEQINDKGDNYKITGTKGNIAVAQQGSQTTQTTGNDNEVLVDVVQRFNAATAGATNQEVVGLLKRLAESINEILVHLPSEHQTSVAADAEAFAKEAASKSPRSSILTALKDGLLATLSLGWKAAVPVITSILTSVIKAATSS